MSSGPAQRAEGGREYSPAAGRFLQRDPLVNGSLNTYESAYSDPWNNSDSTGLLSKGGIDVMQEEVGTVTANKQVKAVNLVTTVVPITIGRSSEPTG